MNCSSSLPYDMPPPAWFWATLLPQAVTVAEDRHQPRARFPWRLPCGQHEALHTPQDCWHVLHFPLGSDAEHIPNPPPTPHQL